MNPTATQVRRQIHTPPVPASPFPHHPGSLLSASDLTLDGLSHILTRATKLEKMDRLVRDRILAKRRVALLFYESSTRTRTSFELAAKALGADTALGFKPQLEHRKGRDAEGYWLDAAGPGCGDHYSAP